MTEKEFIEAIADKIQDEALPAEEYGKAVAQVSICGSGEMDFRTQKIRKIAIFG